MYYVYDEYCYYVAKTDSYLWAKKMANFYNGYVKQFSPFDEWDIVIYDSQCIYEDF